MNTIRIIILIAIASGAWIIYDFGSTFVKNYTNFSAQVAKLNNDVRLRDARLTSMQRQVDRRNEAIAASKCATEIQRWINFPNEIPKKFDPFTNSPLAP